MNFYVYILTNTSRTLYIRVTDDLNRRLSQHRAGLGGDFMRRYHCHMLASCAVVSNVAAEVLRSLKLPLDDSGR